MNTIHINRRSPLKSPTLSPSCKETHSSFFSTKRKLQTETQDSQSIGEISADRMKRARLRTKMRITSAKSRYNSTPLKTVNPISIF